VISTFPVLDKYGLQVNPFIASLLDKLPAAGNSAEKGDGLNTTGYAFNARNNTTRDNVTGKLDYYLSAKNAFSGSYIWNRDVIDRPDQGTYWTAVPPIYNDNHANFLSASWRWNPAPALTNELRGGFNRAVGTFNTRQDNPAFLVTGLNFTSPLNSGLPETRRTSAYSVQDNATWIKGRHSLSFGFQATLWTVSSAVYAGTLPSYGIGLSTNSGYGYTLGQIPGASSTDITRANNLLASLGGLITSSAQIFNVTSRTSGFVSGAPTAADMRMNNYAPYVLDTWKLARRFTLTLGLRWEYFTPADEANGLLVQPRVASGNPVEALLGNSTLDFAGKAVGRPLYKKDLNNFSPNFGFAWDVFGNGRTAVRGGYSGGFANDNLINDVYNVGTTNVGLTTNVTANNLTGNTSNPPSIKSPVFQLPTTAQAQFALSTSSPPIQGLIDPNLATPYVQQWNFGIQQELRGFVIDARYIGNHAVKQFRQIDFNQINVNQEGFLQDFLAARGNGFLAAAAGKGFDPRYNAAIAGSQPTPFFDRMPGGGFLTNALVTGPLQTGEIGTLAQTYQSNLIFPHDGFSFFPNPLVLYSSMLTNLSNSSYNGGQIEVRRRTQNGMQFQASYVFSKALSDASLSRGLEPQLDNSNSQIERARAPYDLTHQFKVNHYIPLPFGPGRRFNSGSRILSRIEEGWGLSGFLQVQSGPPVSILSARGTLNRGSRSGSNTVDTTLTLSQLQGEFGQYMTANGPYFINPSHISASGQGVAPDGAPKFTGQIFSNPQPGSLGSLQRRLLNGPWFNNYNFAVSKNTRLTERQSIEFRADFYNLFNHPNFLVGDQNVNDSTFGKITGQYYTIDGIGPRMVQFGLFYRF
jgi:hypothetical protein